MKNDQTASGQNTLPDLRAEIVKIVHKRGRQSVVCRIGGEEWRHKRIAGARPGQWTGCGVQCRNHIRRQHAKREAQRGKNGHWRECAGFGFADFLIFIQPPHSQKAHRKNFHETRHRQRRRKRQSCAAQRENHFCAGRGQFRRAQHRLQREPFTDEAIERRQRGDGQRADEKAERGQRHPLVQAAESVHVACAGLRFHRAHAKEQQRFV